MTQPSRDERLRELVSIVNGVWFGMPGYDARLVEMSAGFPSRGEGPSSGVSDPTYRAVEQALTAPRRDPSAEAQAAFDHRLERVMREVQALWDEYARHASPHRGVAKITDPGCELCDLVPDHWCPTYSTVEITEPAKAKREPAVRRIRLCMSCYEFNRPDRADRLPTKSEVIAHAEGRRRSWKVGA